MFSTSASRASDDSSHNQPLRQRLSESLKLIESLVPFTRRVVHAGDRIHRAGDRLSSLYVVNSGIFKIVHLALDGHEQVSGFQFKGDWLGFDGIASGRHETDAIAMDTGEVWIFRYDDLLGACVKRPALMAMLHEAMSREIMRDRQSLMSLCTLPANARVADFLRYWVDSLAERGLRTDQITLRLTPTEIGNFLGIKLETVSRAMSRLAREKIIAFSEAGRRAVSIPDPAALGEFVQRSLAAALAKAH